MGVRAIRRSNSLPSSWSNVNIDEALSRGSRGSQFTRECIQGIPPLLNDEEISPSKKELESLKKERDRLTKEVKDVSEERDRLTKEVKDVSEERDRLTKEVKDLSEERDRLTKELKDVSEERDKLPCALELREILSKFLESNDVKEPLMREARRMFPNEFPEVKFRTFMATIRKVLEANEGTEHKLKCLQEVAKSFRLRSLPWWDEEMGELVYQLCINVVRWNEFDIHPKIERLRKILCMNKASKGLYKFDGVDFGPFVKEALHTSNAPRTRGCTT